MAHKPEIRQACRSAYVYDRLSLPDAAESVGIPYNTARVWKKRARAEGDDWDKARTAARLAEGGLGDLTRMVLSDFTHQFQTTLERLKGYEGDPVDAAQAMTRLAGQLRQDGGGGQQGRARHHAPGYRPGRAAPAHRVHPAQVPSAPGQLRRNPGAVRRPPAAGAGIVIYPAPTTAANAARRELMRWRISRRRYRRQARRQIAIYCIRQQRWF